MSSFGARAVSVRVGLILLEDIVGQVGDVDSFSVEALDLEGLPVVLNLRFTQKWGGRGWHRQLECDLCGNAARVLQINGDIAGCGRCVRRCTRHHLRKNRASWKTVETIADRILRLLEKPRRAGGFAKARSNAEQLRRASTAGAGLVLENAGRVLSAVDELRRRRSDL